MITDGKVIKHNHTCDFNIFLGKDKILGMNMMSLVTYYPEFQPQLTERANNDLFDTEKVQLGSYQDAAPVLDTSLGFSGIPTVLSPAPFEEFTMDHTLEREYALPDIIWSSTGITGNLLNTYEFPGDLLTQTFIADKIKNFYYFKAGVKLSFRVSTNRFTTGSLMVVFVPHGPVSNYDFSGDIFHKSGYEHILLSANQSGTVTYELPYIHPSRYLVPGESRDDDLWTVKAYINDPLENINGEACEVRVEVFAHFQDVRLAVPKSIPQSSVASESLLKSDGVVTQIDNATKPIVAAVRTAAGYASYTNAFAGSVMSIARTMQMGLSKPLSLNYAQKVTSDNFSDLNIGTGISTANTMGMTYENRISTAPLFTKESDEMRFTTLMGTPQMSYKKTLLKADFDSGSAFIVAGTPGNNLNTNTYVDKIVQLFKFNSGSMKLKFYIFSNSMVKARAVIWLVNNSTSTDVKWQDCYHRVIDIEGDSTVEVTVPYMDKRISSYSNDNPFFVKFKLLSWSQPYTTADVPIYLNVYKAAASDFRVDVPKDVLYTVQSNPRFDFSRDFEPLHPSFKSYEHSGLLFGEEYKTVKECVSRPLPLKILTRSGTNPPSDVNVYEDTGNVSNKKFYHVGLWGLFYRYHRGSMEYRIVTKTGFGTAILLADNDIIPCTNIVANGINKISVPYYHATLMQNNIRGGTSSTTALRLKFNTAAIARFLYESVGDDFSFHYIQPPPPGTFSSTDTPMTDFNDWASSTTL